MSASTVAELHAGFVDPPIEAAPMMRWWWFGPSVDEAGIDRQLTAMARAGLGGVEVAFVYPLAEATTELLSPEFGALLRHAAEKTVELGMRFDLTVGSGWSYGGRHIGPEHAARRLHWDRYEIAPGPHAIPVPAAWPGDELVAAWLGAGSLQEEPDGWTLLEHDETTITVPDGTGTRVVLVATSRLTGQLVKRAAAGAEGPVFDHYSAAATAAHLSGFGDPLLDAVPAELITSVFCDSLEVYEADWTPDLVAEFTRRRGYDPVPLLPGLVSPPRPDPVSDDIAGFRADVGLTLTELYEDHFVKPMRAWAAGRGVDFRIQGYGCPPAGVSSYRFADRIEGEGWGWTELTQTRWASSAAHLYDRRVCSSETWTWVHSPSLRATPLDLIGEAHEHALLGVNHFIGHGWPYSPADAPGLGWLFYASGALDDRNPWWGAAPEVFGHLRRLAWVLRQGRPVADVAVYVPMRDVHARLGAGVGGSLDAWKEAARLIDPAVISTIRTSGHDYDLIDDDAIREVPDAAARPVIVVPPVRDLPEATRVWLSARAAAGALVVTLGEDHGIAGATPASVARLAAVIGGAGDPDLVVTGSSEPIGHVHRRVGDLDVFFVANPNPHRAAVTVRPRSQAPCWQRWDLGSGAVVDGGSTADGIALDLEPYQGVVLVLGDEPSDPAPVRTAPGRTVALDGPWTATYPDGTEAEVTLPHLWDADPAHRALSGTVVYRTGIELEAVPELVELDLGPVGAEPPTELEAEGIRGNSYRARVETPVRDVAEVIVNGGSCGRLWAPPYRLDVGDALEVGTNVIEIAVSNTGANALAHDEHLPRLVAASRERYGRRFAMQDLTRALDGVGSGLRHRPRLRLG